MNTPIKSSLIIAVLVTGVTVAYTLKGYHPQSTVPITTTSPLAPLENIPKNIAIQSEMHGKIVKIYVKNNQRVKRGDILLELDPTAYLIALEQAQANLALAQRQTTENALSLQAAQALVAQREAELSDQTAVLKRKETLADKGYYPKQKLLEANTQVKVAQTALTLAKLQFEKTRTIVDPAMADPAVTKAMGDINQAQLNLNRTKITAPADGVIVSFELYPDQVISAHQPLLMLRPSQQASNNVQRQPRLIDVKSPPSSQLR